MANIKKLQNIAKEITDGFKIIETPPIFDKDELDNFYKENGHALLDLCPKISGAFPIVFDMGKGGYSFHFRKSFYEKKTEDIGRSRLKVVPHTQQQSKAFEFQYIIETAGKLFENLEGSLKHYGDWTRKSPFYVQLPTDTPDNGFIQSLMGEIYNPENKLKNAIECTKKYDKSDVKQIREIPESLRLRPFFVSIMRLEEPLKGMSEARQNWIESDIKIKNQGMSNFLLERPDDFKKYFASMRNLYETGAKMLNEFSNIDYSRFPRLKQSFGDNIKVGDYVQGVFVVDDYYEFRDGIVGKIQTNDNLEYKLCLENAGTTGDGLGNGTVENAIVKPKKHYRTKIWKFEPGNYS